MAKHDLRFHGFFFFLISFLSSSLGTAALLAPKLSPDENLPSWLPMAGVYACFFAAALGAFAFSMHAKSKDITAAWAFGGLSLCSPVVGLIMWFVLNAQADERPDMADELLTPMPRELRQWESNTIKVQYASDAPMLDDAERYIESWKINSHEAEGSAAQMEVVDLGDRRSIWVADRDADLASSVSRTSAPQPHSKRHVW